MVAPRCETIGDCTLWLGDCRAIWPAIDPSVSIVTDPPFGISADKANAHSSIRDNATWDHFGWDTSRPEPTLFRAIAAAPEAAIWGGNFFADLLPPSAAWLAWVKPEADTGFSLADLELCWTNKHFAARMKKFPRRDGHDHPTQKPVQVMRWTLGFLAGTTIFDPFAGVCSTGVACVQLGRAFIGCELQEKYWEIGCRRLEAAYKQLDLFTPPPKAPAPTQPSLFTAQEAAC
jgi:hypothetical protein